MSELQLIKERILAGTFNGGKAIVEFYEPNRPHVEAYLVWKLTVAIGKLIITGRDTARISSGTIILFETNGAIDPHELITKEFCAINFEGAVFFAPIDETSQSQTLEQGRYQWTFIPKDEVAG